MIEQNLNIEETKLKLVDFRILTEHPTANSLLEFEVNVPNLPNNINVYREDEIDLSIILVSASGKKIKASGFYFQEYSFKGNIVGDEAKNEPVFRFRINPFEAGMWSFSVTLKILGKITDTFCGNVDVMLSDKGSRLLSVEPKCRRNFITKNGENIVFIGRNLCWSMPIKERNIFADYVIDNMQKLTQNGGNMFRIWDFLECGSYIKKGVFSMNQKASAMWDKVFECADKLGVYISFVCISHGEVSSKIDSVFDRSPWCINNGGYIEKAEDFFVERQTKSAFKAFLRYVISRWGYSDSIIYELFNEIDHSDAMVKGKLAEVKAWLSEMSEYIRANDAYGHMVTNSAGAISVNPALYDGFDFLYHHIYNFYSLSQLAEMQKSYQYAYNCPIVIGEFGFADAPNMKELLEHRFFSKDFLELHQGNWSGIMGGGASTTMPWWWYEIPKEFDSYNDYKVISAFAKKIPWSRTTLVTVSNETVKVTNAKIGVMGYLCRDCAYLWLYDNNYLSMCRDMSVFEKESFELPIADGEYLIEFIDTYTGEIINTYSKSVTGGKELFLMPVWSKDIAVRITLK